jgi:two-component system, chemotaxis family, response regulator Rcp1
MQDAMIAERLILLVDDDLHHAHFIEDALRQSSQPHRILAIADGIQVMDFLHRRNGYETASRPDLITPSYLYSRIKVLRLHSGSWQR